MTGQGIARCARGFIGTKWAHQGTSKEQGVDCRGLVIASALGAGWKPKNPAIIEYTSYRMDGVNAPLMDFINAEADKVSEMAIGDILVFRYEGQKMPHHLGICSRLISQNGKAVAYFVHADAGLRRVVETPMFSYWPGRLQGIYRIKGAHNG